MKNENTIEALVFAQKLAQLSKALWKAAEKDWQQWIKPYDLNINEHHILWIAYHLNGASISDVAKFGVMHVSTAFNFSKKLEERGLLTFSKKVDDKRNTYIQLTEAGKKIVLDILNDFNPKSNTLLQGTLPLKELYGKFPDILELTAIIRNIYGDDFMEIFHKSFHNLEQQLIEQEIEEREDFKEEAI